MALIKCPECGQEVSDRAATCPKCAFPLSELKTDGIVRIKLMPSGLNSQAKFQFSKRSTCIRDGNGNVLWSGRYNQIAQFHVDGPTTIYVDKSLAAYDFSSTVEAGKKYQAVVVNMGIRWKNRFQLEEVDVIDSD